MRNEQSDVIGGKGLKVCAYYRMSDDEQQLSIGQQEKEVRKLCDARGWIITEEFTDSGKSGSKDIAKRKAFHAMVAAAKSGRWNAIVCYNSSRFGRLDTLDAAPFKNELRKHGVYLETVGEGRIDWRTSMGRIQDAIMSEQNHKYSTDLAESTVRGRLDVLNKGWWPVGKIPFGYDREFVENGVSQMVISRTKPFKKPRNWHTVLKVNPTDAAIVKSVFKRFATADISARALVKELNADKVASPGISWTPQMLLQVLRDESYIGRCKLGFSRKSKEAHNRITQTVVENACPPIVDVKTFEIVAAKLDTRKRSENSAQKRSGALSGILICGHCGYRMDKKERGKYGVLYSCSSGSRRQHLGCKQWQVREADLMPILAKELLSAVDVELLNRLQSKPKDETHRVEAQKQQLAKLEKQYEKARANLLLVDTDLFAALQAEVLKMKAEVERLRNTLVVMEDETAKNAAKHLHEWWAERRDTLVDLSVPRWDVTYPKQPRSMYSGPNISVSSLEYKADREAIRDLLKTLGATLTLHWSTKGQRYHQLDFGVLKAGGADFIQHVLNADSSKCSHGCSRGRH